MENTKKQCQKSSSPPSQLGGQNGRRPRPSLSWAPFIGIAMPMALHWHCHCIGVLPLHWGIAIIAIGIGHWHLPLAFAIGIALALHWIGFGLALGLALGLGIAIDMPVGGMALALTMPMWCHVTAACHAMELWSDWWMKDWTWSHRRWQQSGIAAASFDFGQHT